MLTEKGLSRADVESRLKSGLVNKTSTSPAKTTAQIVRSNTVTFFNILNASLAALVLAFGDIINALFMLIIIINTAVGIIQEIRAKRVIDKLSLICSPKVRVLRDGVIREIRVEEIVLGECVKLTAGMQICADSVVLEGECEVNESIITGESEPVTKLKGDELLSGSFVVSGAASTEVVRVGDNNFANKIINNVKYIKHSRSQIMNSMNHLIKGIAFCIIPIGAILVWKALNVLAETPENAVTATVAALIGMIPEGLVLLISAVFSISIIRLSRHKALVRELHSVETLARVDVLCLDKTGTITTGKMSVREIIPLKSAGGGSLESTIAQVKSASELLQIKHTGSRSDSGGSPQEIVGRLMAVLPDENPTAVALRERFPCAKQDIPQDVKQLIAFSSAKKWSGANFSSTGSYIIGAPEIIAKSDKNSANITERVAKGGGRVVMLAHSPLAFEKNKLPSSVTPLALFVISEEVRKEAPETLKFFREQGVTIKIISGDNPLTVSGIAGRVGLHDYERYIDMNGVALEEISEIAEKYSVFGRVTPDQKLALIKALKAKGHTVGMTGDGVNDVLALKESDCSIAMQSGADAAKNVSNLILLESNFAVLPKVVAEGRRSINNIERSAVLFLSKTVYAAIIALCFLFINSPFPLIPFQMTVINACFIGAPSFLLALEPNTKRQSGRFILNVLKKALPFGVCSLLSVLAVTFMGNIHELSADEIRTVSTYIYGASSFAILVRVCMPFNLFKAVMTVSLGGAFVAAMVIFRKALEHVPLTEDMTVITFAACAIILPLIIFLPNMKRLTNN
ncbi:MAG: HAD-IC family P-type ATPase [Oscillospiraceae bacterium]|nr:HAD-IC family P-type ATPase [Oscillospiraceae bacterium]